MSVRVPGTGVHCLSPRFDDSMRTLEEIYQGMDEQVFIARAQSDFKFFCKRVMTIDIENGIGPVEIEPFHEEWIAAIENNDRVAIVAPTGHGKSVIFSISYACWLLAFKENVSILIVTNQESNAKYHLRRIKSAIDDNAFLQRLKPLTGRSKSWSKTEIETTKGGHVMVRACTENIQGLHVDYIIADEVAAFDKSVYYGPVSSRVNAKKGKIAAISTPKNETDLIMELTNPDKNTGYIGMRYKACEIDVEGAIIPESILWPEKYSVEYLEKKKREMLDYDFSLQYLCDPVPKGSALVTRKDLMAAFDRDRILMQTPIQGRKYYMGVDIAVAQSKPTAATAIFTLVEEEGRLVIAHVRWMRGLGIKTQETIIEQEYLKWKPFKPINLDSTTIGISFTQELRNRGVLINPVVFTPDRRMEMLKNLTRMFGQGKIVIPWNLEDPFTSRMMKQLIKELERMVWSVTPQGKTTIKKVGTTNDMVMALALACYQTTVGAATVDKIYPMRRKI